MKIFVKKIFQTLSDLERKEEVKAEEVMKKILLAFLLMKTLKIQ